MQRAHITRGAQRRKLTSLATGISSREPRSAYDILRPGRGLLQVSRLVPVGGADSPLETPGAHDRGLLRELYLVLLGPWAVSGDGR